MKTTQMTLFSALIFFWVGAAMPASRGPGGPNDTVRQKFDAFNRHDVAAIEAIYATHARLDSPDYPGLQGNGPIADTYRQLFESIPDAKDTLVMLERSGHHVYAQFVLTGHWKGAEDKPLRVRIISVYAIEGGRITDDSTYYDRKAQ